MYCAVMVVGEQEIHDTNDVVAVGSVQERLLALHRCRNSPGPMHSLDAVLVEHYFREIPGLPIVFHSPLRPGPLPVVQ